MTLKKLALFFVITSTVAATGLAAPATASHGNCADGRTNKASWFISGGVPSAWYDALINSALVWDNISGIGHDFVRYQGPPADFNVFRGSIDGGGNVLAITPADHSAIKYDSAESWHLNVNVQPGASSIDLWSVGAHEMGHILSLAHSECYGVGGFPVSNTMYSTYTQGTAWWRTLEDYDRQHALGIYP